MQYLLLIYGNEKQFNAFSEAEKQAIMKEYDEYTQSIAASGHLRGGRPRAVSVLRTLQIFVGLRDGRNVRLAVR